MSALNAGVDMDLGGTAYMTLTKLIKSGQVRLMKNRIIIHT
jgi:hypothetical protein